ncbi:hypothetical protein R6Q57_007318 [Mikania cordata]
MKLDFASESLLSTPWPSRKDEPFRFTDTSLIKQSEIIPVSSPPPLESLNNSIVFEDAQLLNLTIIDGYVVDSLSRLSGQTDEKSSTYELVEVSSGGKLSRHNVHVQQVGSDTITGLSTFHLSGCDQTQDLHSKIVLDHPRGFSRQLHKCIVAHSLGQAVFDGNIKTDAGQLTRSLILEPRATVNVKPNLQIIADDAKCSHGAAIAICDLEEEQLFYLQARGIDLKTARKALIVSFGAEVIDRFPSSDLRKVELHVKKLLDPEVHVENSV